ncbi:MAG: IS110 family transposase [Bacilli bacterium]|jgi:transposase|nr:IS110 family transposase [Bacilli bacterium]
MYFVGIDISKHKHDCFITNEAGEVIKDIFTFDNTGTGFSQFFDVLVSLGDPKQIKVGFEATGHYMNNLMKHLSVKGYSFTVLNPIIVARFRSSTTLRRIKTDSVDARLIAHYLSLADFKSYHLQVYHFPELKSLTRMRDHLVKQRSFYLVMLTNSLDQVFPEFKAFFGNNLKSKTAQYILHKYIVPSRIATMNAASFDHLRLVSKGKFSFAKFTKLRELASATVGCSSETDALLISSTLRLFDRLDEEIKTIESKIESIMLTLDSPTASIPGIGLTSTATIIAEFGHLSRFEHADKMVAFAGLDCGRSQSGTQDFKGKMVKHGSGYLRQALMNSAAFVLIHVPTFYEYYHKKRLEGKAHRVALSHVARKLVRLIYKLETSNTRFDLSQFR